MNTEPLDYKTIELYAKIVAKNILDDGQKFHGIVCVSRGGLIPTYLIAKHLGIKTVRTVCLSSYSDENEQMQIQNLDASQDYFFPQDEKWLIIDDLSDTGRTLQYVVDYYFTKYKNYSTATLLVKDETEYIPEYYAALVQANMWLDFEYELM